MSLTLVGLRYVLWIAVDNLWKKGSAHVDADTHGRCRPLVPCLHVVRPCAGQAVQEDVSRHTTESACHVHYVRVCVSWRAAGADVRCDARMQEVASTAVEGRCGALGTGEHTPCEGGSAGVRSRHLYGLAPYLVS